MSSASSKRPARKPIGASAAEKRRFSRSIRVMFENMGFTYIPTEGVEGRFGNKTGELDSVYMHENILLIVEDTTATTHVFEHAKNKCLLAKEIDSHKSDFIDWLKSNFADHHSSLSKYSPRRFRIFFLYVSMVDMELNNDSVALLQPMKIVSPSALGYFDKLAKAIRRSSRTDFWRFLDLKSKDVGAANATNDVKTINTTIISPEDNTGFSNGVRLVSFMISADVLLRNSYVLRKDNWGYSTNLYQRMVDSTRITGIRKYIASEGAAFLNNIIIGLPEDVTFQTGSKSPVKIDEVQDYSAYRMTIPDEFNSLCIIDGQHRVFAHFEGTDDLEPQIAALRSKVHLLATGVVFPSNMTELERLQLQSEMFLNINSNTKPVPADVLLAIQSLRAPFTDAAVARRVLEDLNSRNSFRGLFQLTQMDRAPIKIASIVKFALRYLVDVDSDAGLFSQWVAQNESHRALESKKNLELLDAYIKFCGRTLDAYFGALKKSHPDDWGVSGAKITSTTVINAMIIALRKSIPTVGVLDFTQYDALIQNWDIDFSRSNFKYSSSQYARFSQDILRDMFKLDEAG